MRTDIIRYNLRERGRTYRGKPRNFDIPRLVAAINGGPCQEKVKHRDMFGYYGHWPRIKFGMNPAEGGVVDGKAVRVEPALVTTYLKAYDDGTIEHKAEFLETDAGRLAWSLYKSKAGGFSSAIDEMRGPEFYGFDYVLEPNYSTNRGYELSLDCVLDPAMTLDDAKAAAEAYSEHVRGMKMLLDCVLQDRDGIEARLKDVEQAYHNSLEALGRLKTENEQLLSMLTVGKKLDSLENITEAEIGSNKAEELRRRIESFEGVKLIGFEEPKPKERKNPLLDSVIERLWGG